jgi:transcriptional regulator with XRE-family HTH domain
MKASEAFDFVLDYYGIQARDIAKKIGKSETHISKFRNGHRNISADLLQKIIIALPVMPRTHFCMLWMAESTEDNTDLVEKATA